MAILINQINTGKIQRQLRTIHLTYLPDEEVGGIDGAMKLVISKDFEDLNVGVALDEGLANPLEKYTVFNGERTPWWVKIKATGPTGHGSRFLQSTAVEKLTSVLTKAYELRRAQENLLHNESGCKHSNAKKLGDVLTLNVTVVQAGVTGGVFDGYCLNCVPSEAFAAIDMRIPPSFPLKDVEAILSEWTKEEGLSYEFYTRTNEHCVTSTEDNVWWNSFKDTMAQLKKEIEVEIFPAATDSRFFRQRKLPCFGFSPMSNTPILLHDHNEYINEKVFLDGIAVYEKLILNLANVNKF